MTIQVNLPDGSQKFFPDGTSNEEIQRQVKETIGVREQPFRELAQEPGFLQTGAISTGRGLFRIGRALGLTGPETEVEKKAFEMLSQERPVTTTVGEAVGEALPFAAVPVGAIPGVSGRVLAATGLGALEGGLIARGAGETESEQIRSAGVGGLISGGIEALLPHIGRLGVSLVKKVSGRVPTGPLLTRSGLPTEELSSALEKTGLNFEDLEDAAIDVLRQQPEGVSPEQAARKAFLEGQGLVEGGAPTTAQVTREAAEFQAQQEAAKTSSRVRTRLESQQGILTNKFDETIAGTSGQPVTSGSPVFDHIQNKATTLDNEISELYGIARDRAEGGKIVDMSKTVNRLKSMRPSDKLMKGVISATEGEFARLGLTDETGKVLRRATVEEAELIRKFTNQIFQSTSDFGRTGIAKIKNAIDDDVMEFAGKDVFNQARAAKAKFEQDLSRSKINKFDKRGVDVVRDILGNKIDPEQMMEKIVLGKKYRVDDILQIKKYLTTGTPEQIEQGTKAFDDLRAETLDYIKNKSFVGPEDADGNKNLSRAALESALNRIGDAKMSALFSGEERMFLKNVSKVAKLLEPVRGTQLGKGPTAQAVSTAVQSLKRRVDKLPILNMFVDLELSQAGSVLKGKPIVRQKLLPTKTDVLRGAAVAGAVTPITEEREQ